MTFVVNTMDLAILFMDLDKAGAHSIVLRNSTVIELSELRVMLNDGTLKDADDDDYDIEALPVIANSKKDYGGD